jgi:hypothetical protein
MDSIIMMTPKETADDGGDDSMDGEDVHMRNVACVPSQSLAEEGVAPEEGDEVHFSVVGTVGHVEGEETYVKIKSVNGQDVSSSFGDSEDAQDNGADEDQEDQMGNLEKGAASQDASNGY